MDRLRPFLPLRKLMNYSVEYNCVEGRLTHLFFLVEKEPDRVVGLVGRQELEQRLASLTNTLF